MARTVRRRRRRSSSESGNYIEMLDDCLLIEILRLLPDAKSAIKCKLVSKRWSSLISDPSFKTSFVDYHSTSRNKKQKPYLITFCDVWNYKIARYKLFSSNSVFKGFDYDYAVSFPKCRGPYRATDQGIQVCATYNELLLCECQCYLDFDKVRYYICNPVTKHHVALPPCPRLGLDPIDATDVAGFLFRDQSSFRVMIVLRSSPGVLYHELRESTMLIFSSEGNQWTQHQKHEDRWVRIFSVNTLSALAWNGLLCWVRDDTSTLVSCNPYTPDEPFHIINPPEELRHVERKYKSSTPRQGIGVCQGTLRLWHQWQGLDDYQNFSVWDLKDYNTGEWSLKFEFQMEPVYRERWFYDIIVAFDPDDEDVAFFVYKKTLVSFDMRSQAMKRLKTIIKPTINHRMNFHSMKFLMLVMPWWPTPVPTLPSYNGLDLLRDACLI